MQRFLILLLVLFLPIQASAEILRVAEQTFPAEVAPVIQQILDDLPVIDEIEMHVDLADETVPSSSFAFVAITLFSIVVLSNDKAHPPPFLPPFGPPPRVVV